MQRIKPLKANILIVEDNSLTAAYLSDFLQDNGLTVFLANTPEMAYHIVSKEQVDIIIMDIILGTAFDGIDIAKNILMKKDLPIIFFSGSENMVKSERLNEINFYGYFIKGTPLVILLKNIELALKFHNKKEKTEDIFSIIDTLPFLLLVYDFNNKKIIKINNAFSEYSQYSKDYIEGKDISQIILNFNANHTKKQNIYNQILDIKLANSEIHKLNCIISKMFFNHKHFVVIVSAPYNEQISPENDAFVSISGFKQIFDKSYLGVFTYNKEGIITNCNEVFASIIGVPKSKLIGLNINILPNKAIVAALNQALEGNIGKYEGLYTSYLAGKTTPVRVLFLPILKDDDIIGGVCITEDFTEKYNYEQNLILTLEKLKQEKARNQALLDANPDMMFMFDKNGNIVDFSASSYKDLYVPPEVFLNKNIYEVLPKDIADLSMQKIHDLENTNNIQIYSYQLNINGEDKIFESRLVKCGESYYLSIVRDITDKERAYQMLVEQLKKTKELNEKLEKLNKELAIAKQKAEEGERIKTKFIHNISHEIRTPMNALIGFTQILTTKNLTDDKKEYYAQIIEKSSFRLLEVIDDILKLSAITNENVTINLVRFNLIDIFNEILDKFQKEAKEKSLDFIVEGLEKIQNTVIEIDYQKFKDILAKLLSNAIKYTEKGYIKLDINIDNNVLIIKVIDTGRGLPKFDIYKPFEKDCIETKSIDEGLGIGLAIVKSYVEICKGTIDFETERNKGTTFTVRLPLKFSDEITAGEIVYKNILIVEDDIFNYNYLYELLKTHTQCNIYYAKNGYEALEIVQNNNIDLIFMDLKMPGLNGIETTKKIKVIKNDIKIIALTAYMSDTTEPEILKLFNSVLTKPVNVSRIKEILKIN